MEGHQGISSKGSFTHLSSEGEQGQSSYQNLVSAMVIAERLLVCTCDFTKRAQPLSNPL